MPPRGPPPPKWLAILGRIVWTVGGLGLVPLGPGTIGTLAGVALVYLASLHPQMEQKLILGMACGVMLVGVPLANLAERVHGKDPPSFVWDEVGGYLVSMLGMPLREHAVLCVWGGFFVFRIFDILKPWPARAVEERPGGIAVMADDIVAALYTNVTLHTILFVMNFGHH